MIANYLLSAWRAFQNQKLIYSINIAGLTIALAVCLLMLGFARYESSYDQFHPDAERLYSLWNSENRHKELGGFVAPLSKQLMEKSPDIDAYTPYMAHTQPLAVEAGDQEFKVTTHYVSERFLSVFNLPFSSGDLNSAFAQPGSAVITEQLANKLFGTREALGKSLLVVNGGQKAPATITGIIQQPPGNSIIRGELFLRPVYDFLSTARVPIAIKLKSGVKPAAAERTLNALEIAPITEGYFEPEHFRGTAQLSPLSHIHLAETFHIMQSSGGEGFIITYQHLIWAALALSVLVLAIACANYINLHTASAIKRTREIALRKVMGANRWQLAGQFIIESVLLAWFAALLAAPLISLSSPWLFDLMGLEITVDELFPLHTFWLLAGLVTAVGIIAGAYPAWHISRLAPTAAFRGGRSTHSKRRLTGALVVAQFCIVCLLMALTLATNNQLTMLKQRDQGYNPEHLYVAADLTNLFTKPQGGNAFLDKLQELPFVKAASVSNACPVYPQMRPREIRLPTAAVNDYKYVGMLIETDGRFLDVYRPPLVAGRYLSRDILSDWTIAPLEAQMTKQEPRGGAVVLSESALKILGVDRPQDILGKVISMRPGTGELADMESMSEEERKDHLTRQKRTTQEFTVVGIVPAVDFGRSTTTETIAVYTLNKRFFVPPAFSVRTAGNNPAAERKQIEQTWKEFFPSQEFDLKYMPQLLEDDFRNIANMVYGLMLFAGLAVVIACLGLFAMTSFNLVQRTKEMGVRKVLGATGKRVLWFLLRDFSKPVLLAIVLALVPGYLLANYLLSNFPSHVDLGVLFVAQTIAITLAIAWGVLSLHTAHVLRLDPAQVLKSD